MLKITNGEQTLIVTKGAFKEMYSPAGWVVVNTAPTMPLQELAKALEEGGGSNPPSDQEDSPEDLSEEDTLKNMSEVELKQYASLLGIKTKSLKTREELMEAIKAHKE